MKSFVVIAVSALVLAVVSADFDDGNYMVSGMGGFGGGMGGFGGSMGGVGVQYPIVNAAQMCTKNHRQMLMPTVHTMMPAQTMVQAGQPVFETTNVYSMVHPRMHGSFSEGLSFGDDMYDGSSGYYSGSPMFGSGMYASNQMSGMGGMYSGGSMMGAGQFGASQMYAGGQMGMGGVGQFGGSMGSYGGGQQMFAPGMSGTY